MHVREWINDNSPMVTIAVAVLLMLVAGALFLQMRGSTSPAPSEVYFLDLDTGEAFPQPRGTLAPVTAPSGGRGVRAHFYTCGECTPEERFGYLETFGDEAGQRPEAQGGASQEASRHMVRDLDNDGRWVPYFSEAGERIRAQYEISCPDDPTRSPDSCWP